MPQSTVRIPTPEANIGPIVDPHPISFLTTNSCTTNKTLSCLHTSEQKDDEDRDVKTFLFMLFNLGVVEHLT